MVRKGELEELMSKVLWKPGEGLENYEFVVITRGLPGDREVIRGSDVSVRKGYLLVSSGEKIIPFHRILEVRDLRTGKVVWRSRRA